MALVAGAKQNQPQCNGCAVGFPVGKIISPAEVMALRKTTTMGRTQVVLGWMQLCLGERMHICVHAPWAAKPVSFQTGLD